MILSIVAYERENFKELFSLARTMRRQKEDYWQG